MTVFAAGSTARTMDFEEGDVGYIPISNPHYIQNTGDTDLVFLEMFRTSEYQDISLAEWMAHTPHLLMDQHLGVGMSRSIASPNRRWSLLPFKAAPQGFSGFGAGEAATRRTIAEGLWSLHLAGATIIQVLGAVPALA